MSVDPPPPPPGFGPPAPVWPNVTKDAAERAAANVQLLGILSIVLGVCIPVGGLVAGSVALATLGKARRDAAELGDKDSLDKIATGQTCAIVGLVITFLNMIVIFVTTIALNLVAR